VLREGGLQHRAVRTCRSLPPPDGTATSSQWEKRARQVVTPKPETSKPSTLNPKP